MSTFITGPRVGEMAQWAKGLSVKHKELDVIPDTQIIAECLHVCKPSAGEAETVRLAKSRGSRLRERPCLQK